MAIAASDIVVRLTTKTGAAGDTNAGTPTGSLGGFTSQTAAGTGLNDLFDDVTGAENAASEAEYRAVDILNNHATLTATSVGIWLTSDVTGGAVPAIGVDPAAATAKGGTGQGASIATEDVAPAGVVFSAPTTIGTMLSVGTLAPGQVRRIWIRRTAANTAALNADGATLQISFDTPA